MNAKTRVPTMDDLHGLEVGGKITLSPFLRGCRDAHRDLQEVPRGQGNDHP